MLKRIKNYKSLLIKNCHTLLIKIKTFHIYSKKKKIRSFTCCSYEQNIQVILSSAYEFQKLHSYE